MRKNNKPAKIIACVRQHPAGGSVTKFEYKNATATML